MIGLIDGTDWLNDSFHELNLVNDKPGQMEINGLLTEIVDVMTAVLC